MGPTVGDPEESGHLPVELFHQIGVSIAHVEVLVCRGCFRSRRPDEGPTEEPGIGFLLGRVLTSFTTARLLGGVVVDLNASVANISRDYRLTCVQTRSARGITGVDGGVNFIVDPRILRGVVGQPVGKES